MSALNLVAPPRDPLRLDVALGPISDYRDPRELANNDETEPLYLIEQR